MLSFDEIVRMRESGFWRAHVSDISSIHLCAEEPIKRLELVGLKFVEPSGYYSTSASEKVTLLMGTGLIDPSRTVVTVEDEDTHEVLELAGALGLDRLPGETDELVLRRLARRCLQSGEEMCKGFRDNLHAIGRGFFEDSTPRERAAPVHPCRTQEHECINFRQGLSSTLTRMMGPELPLEPPHWDLHQRSMRGHEGPKGKRPAVPSKRSARKDWQVAARKKVGRRGCSRKTQQRR
mgnify:CR=1 FL=1